MTKDENEPELYSLQKMTKQDIEILLKGLTIYWNTHGGTREFCDIELRVNYLAYCLNVALDDSKFKE